MPPNCLSLDKADKTTRRITVLLVALVMNSLYGYTIAGKKGKKNWSYGFVDTPLLFFAECGSIDTAMKTTLNTYYNSLFLNWAHGQMVAAVDQSNNYATVCKNAGGKLFKSNLQVNFVATTISGIIEPTGVVSNYASCLTTSCSLSTASELMIAELDTIFNQVMNAAVNGNYGIRSISANYNLPKITSG